MVEQYRKQRAGTGIHFGPGRTEPVGFAIPRIGHFAALRWRLLRGVLASEGSQRWAVVLGFVAAVVAGTAGAVVLLTAGRTMADPGPLFVVAAGGVTVNCVSPGTVDTPMLAPNSEMADKLARKIPLRRLGRPEDVANAVLYLASDEASYMTGHVLVICGGGFIS